MKFIFAVVFILYSAPYLAAQVKTPNLLGAFARGQDGCEDSLCEGKGSGIFKIIAGDGTGRAILCTDSCTIEKCIFCKGDGFNIFVLSVSANSEIKCNVI
uniref:Uncharacterized protein n=1 Tax=Clytia hemisphaerica TaxID=252671 RepID=A0A7M5XLE5_9CNID